MIKKIIALLKSKKGWAKSANNGRKTYSDIVTVLTEANDRGDVRISSNPATNNIMQLTHPKAGSSAYIRIIGVYGSVRRVLEVEQDSAVTAIDVSRFTPGLYFIDYHDGAYLSKLSFIKK